jgi:hypothetical protein
VLIADVLLADVLLTWVLVADVLLADVLLAWVLLADVLLGDVPLDGVDPIGEAGTVAVCAGTVASLGLPDGLGETAGPGPSCSHAAMTTRSPAGSALPPTPLGSTK